MQQTDDGQVAMLLNKAPEIMIHLRIVKVLATTMVRFFAIVADRAVSQSDRLSPAVAPT